MMKVKLINEIYNLITKQKNDKITIYFYQKSQNILQKTKLQIDNFLKTRFMNPLADQWM